MKTFSTNLSIIFFHRVKHTPLLPEVTTYRYPVYDKNTNIYRITTVERRKVKSQNDFRELAYYV